MGDFVKGIKSLFSGPDTSAQTAAIADQKQAQTVALNRQAQDEQNSAAVQNQQLGLVSRAPRGRRLLMASTGESGVAGTGTQTTLGGT